MGVNGIYGLSGSGLDIESMVKVGMMSRQSQYDKMQQQYTKNEWKKSAMVDLYSEIQTFNMSTLSQYKMSNNMDAHTAESNNSSIKVTANSNAPIMRHTISVNSAATNAYLIGTSTPTRLGDASSTSTQLKDTLFSDLTVTGDNATYTDSSGNTNIVNKSDVAFKFSVGDGVNGGITSTNPSAVKAVVSDTATSGEHTVNVSQLAEGVTLTGSAASFRRYDNDGNVVSSSTSSQLKNILFKNLTIESGKVTAFESIAGHTQANITGTSDNTISQTASAVKFDIGDGSGNTATINISYKQISEGYSLEDLANDINSQAEANGLTLSASYDSETQAFSVVNTKTSSSSNVSVKTTYNTNTRNYAGSQTAALLNGLGLNDGTSTLSFSANTTTTYKLEGVGESTVKVDTSAIEKSTVSITYGELAEGFTFNDLTSKINSLGQNTRATYDSVNDKFSLYNSQSGSNNTVALAMASGTAGARAADFFNSLGLTQSTNGELSTSAMTFAEGEVSVQAGTNAAVKIDGVNYDLSDNKATVNGVTYDFSTAEAGDTATVAVSQDKDTIISKVKSFIEDYNKLLSDLYKAYDEKPNSNYKPLTESQKAEMKDDQIEKWEEKAKAGMLYHDQTIGKVIDEMRSAMSSTIDGVSGKYNSIFSIGISTTGLKGQLTLDEDKLKAALDDDSESVYNVFAKLDANDYNNAAKSGVAQRLGDVLSAANKSIKSVSGDSTSTNDDSDLSTLMRELQTKMSNFKAMMNAFENRLYKKYDAMETALSGLGIQLNYVTSAFS